MPKLEIIKAGLMTSIQDMGRSGLAYYAIPRSGAMDQKAAKIALLLLDKKESDSLLECTSVAPHLKFHDSTRIVISGADFNWSLNDNYIPRNTVLQIKKGDLLKGQFAKEGLRGYIAIDGELEAEKSYASASTYLNAKMGGHQGRLLQKGDVLFWKAAPENQSNHLILPIQAGPEAECLGTDAREQLSSTIYKVAADSNRMGIRLEGPPLSTSIEPLKHSVPVLPGFIQLPPSGLPIIVLQDGQTTGGYPRIAYVREEYLSLLAQLPLGGCLGFEWI